MGKTIFIKDKLNKNRLEAIQKLKPPNMAKDCKSFAGVVHYLSMFCPNLQKFLKSIYDLTRKGRPFIWIKVHQEAFEETKARLLKPLVLHLPDNKGWFQVSSYISSKTVAFQHCIKFKMILPNLNGM